MPVRVQCPICGAICQIQEQYLGGKVTCGKCTKIFATQKPEPAEASPIASAPLTRPASSSTTSTAPLEDNLETVEKEDALKSPSSPKRSSWWTGVQQIYQRISKPISTAITKKTESAEPGAEGLLEAEEEMELSLDGPVAETLKRQEVTEKEQKPKPGAEPKTIHGQFRLDIGGATSVGKVRDRNEDSFLIQQQTWSNLDQRHDMALMVVADGMGGYQGGDRASHITIKHLGEGLRSAWNNFSSANGDVKNTSWREAVEVAIRSANTVVYQEGQQPATKGMGATAAIVFVCDGQTEIAHVGDCRVYLFHEGNFRQVTRDHTLVERMVELGQLSREEAKNHPKGNEVTKAIGKHAEIQPGYYNLQLVPGDWLIVACDGLHAHVDERMLSQILEDAPPSAYLVANHLVELANFFGGTDNCTVLALRCY